MNAPDALPRLPATEDWLAATQHHAELFAPLDPGARIALLARSAPGRMLLWEAAPGGTRVCELDFPGYAESGADIVLAADDEALAAIRAAAAERLFEVLRAAIRAGQVVCYMLRRRCVLEERGFEEMLEALGFVFMGACR